MECLLNELGLTEPQGIPGIIIFKMNEGKVQLGLALIISALALAFERTGERTARSGNDKRQTPGKALPTSSQIFPQAEKRASYSGTSNDGLLTSQKQ